MVEKPDRITPITDETFDEVAGSFIDATPPQPKTSKT